MHFYILSSRCASLTLWLKNKMKALSLNFCWWFHIFYLLTYLRVLCIFDRIDIKKEKKVRETNDVCMREPEKLNIKRRERKTTLKKNRQEKRPKIKTIEWYVQWERKCRVKTYVEDWADNIIYLLDKNNVIEIAKMKIVIRSWSCNNWCRHYSHCWIDYSMNTCIYWGRWCFYYYSFSIKSMKQQILINFYLWNVKKIWKITFESFQFKSKHTQTIFFLKK